LATRTAVKELLLYSAGLKSCNDTIKGDTMACERRKKIVESDTHAVEGHAVLTFRTRALLPMSANLIPNNCTARPPVDAAYARKKDDTTGWPWISFKVRDAAALRAMLNVNCEILPDKDGVRHTALVSLVQAEREHVVDIRSMTGEDAILENP
jgi:hypothetical protein